MKTTQKYSERVKQIATPGTSPPETQTHDHVSSAPCSRDIVLMRIHHILRSAQELSSS
ncbi:hypothetical protein QQ008_24525 [Fulvivirgaceae bacterium BMA10]|uniref:Uncharacterized protein n=1 Tax=Splendidivirga corallicola TaxID=3051826 RepID=A0ABT8KV04_9BACT|nr:hypothetical protein [Fulvivirgaceae bacterium BMA10]